MIQIDKMSRRDTVIYNGRRWIVEKVDVKNNTVLLCLLHRLAIESGPAYNSPLDTTVMWVNHKALSRIPVTEENLPQNGLVYCNEDETCQIITKEQVPPENCKNKYSIPLRKEVAEYENSINIRDYKALLSRVERLENMATTDREFMEDIMGRITGLEESGKHKKACFSCKEPKNENGNCTKDAALPDTIRQMALY